MRALAFTTASLSLGVTAHVLAGGAAPTVGVSAFLAVFVLVCAQSLAGRERGLGALLLATVAVQAAVHLTLMSGGMTGAPPGGMTGGVSGGMSGMTGAAPGGLPVPGQLMRLTAGMLAAHALAALGVALLLRSAEAGLWRLRRWLSLVVTPLRRAPGVVGLSAAQPSCPTRPGVTCRGLILATARLRRGPPALA